MSGNTKIPLPQWLKFLTLDGIAVPKSMSFASKLYKEFNTPASLALLTDAKLASLGVESKEDRKAILSAFNKAGYVNSGKPRSLSKTKSPVSTVAASPSKRKRGTDEYYAADPEDDDTDDPSAYPFEEERDEEILQHKFVVINRAPVMTAWAMIVAETMHFSRPEALSIASAYTEMNAVSKGISLGIYNKERDTGLEADRQGSQPYVQLMDRRISLYRTKSSHWRALSNGSPVSPKGAYSYLNRCFHQTLPFVLGVLRLLAQSHPQSDLPAKAWNLYQYFRPAIEGWGKKSELHCSKILELRLKDKALAQRSVGQQPDVTNADSAESSEPPRKRQKPPTLEEYEAMLDNDTTFDHVDLNLS